MNNTSDESQSLCEAELSNNLNLLHEYMGINLRQTVANNHDQSPSPLVINNSSSLEEPENNNRQNTTMNFNFEMGGPVSLGMPMRLPEFQMMYSLNPNNRIGTAADNLNSSGIQSSKSSSRNSSVEREEDTLVLRNNNPEQIHFDAEGLSESEDDDDEQNDQSMHQDNGSEDRRIFLGREGTSQAFRFNQFEDVIVDELEMRPSARENSIGRSLVLRPMNQRRGEPALRPRIQPFN